MKSLFVVAPVLIVTTFAPQSACRIMLWLAPSCCSNALFLVAADKDDDDDEEIEEMMEKVHEGKRSPLRQVKEAVRNEPPRWEVIEKQLSKFVKMGELLKHSKNDEIKDGSDGYVDATTGLGKALKIKDAVALRKSFRSLNESCADCHFKGGVGGKLDD